MASTRFVEDVSLPRSPLSRALPYRTQRLSSQWTLAPRELPASGFELVDSSVEVEEETLPGYAPERYYPVHLGNVLDNRYQVLAKLGYGVTSTIWFSRDLTDSKYVALKVYVTGQDRNHELKIYERINSVEASHPGRRFIRKLIDHFYIEGPHSRYTCLVHEP
ncbi:hypothetical protein AJ80_05406 [Polytolypa hystricis UAMH7299]|uniref:non-specific serine/threonine protein kinase n=1 Tax=Polytolypa hystricis (strain UAMH7299) TaxID=1447883 RepID=A0A2B7Y3T7_POLH7|nr:hypothetical protein AJ80_05406 [Polytolypa hystricis UAMH7299]